MSPKSQPEITGQGSFFTTEVVSSGHTDMDHQTHSVQLEIVPEGVYEQSEEPSVIEDDDLTQAVHEAVVKKNRERGQLGKHSPLSREGGYVNIQAGDYLPGFGPVTYRNFAQAEPYAHRLEKARRSQR